MNSTAPENTHTSLVPTERKNTQTPNLTLTHSDRSSFRGERPRPLGRPSESHTNTNNSNTSPPPSLRPFPPPRPPSLGRSNQLAVSSGSLRRAVVVNTVRLDPRVHRGRPSHPKARHTLLDQLKEEVVHGRVGVRRDQDGSAPCEQDAHRESNRPSFSWRVGGGGGEAPKSRPGVRRGEMVGERRRRGTVRGA